MHTPNQAGDQKLGMGASPCRACSSQMSCTLSSLCVRLRAIALLLPWPTNTATPHTTHPFPQLLYPMLALATAASVVASQALLSGVFSILRQVGRLSLQGCGGSSRLRTQQHVRTRWRYWPVLMQHPPAAASQTKIRKSNNPSF